jgi:hypothetical protein
MFIVIRINIKILIIDLYLQASGGPNRIKLLAKNYTNEL